MVQTKIIRALVSFLPTLSSAQLKVYLALCAAVNGDSMVVGVSTAEIGTVVGLNRRTVFGALATLGELGLISKQRSEISGPNRYVISAMNSGEPERPCCSGSPDAADTTDAADITAPESTEAAQVQLEERLDAECIAECGGPASVPSPPQCLDIHGEQTATLADVAVTEPSDLECLETLLGRKPEEDLLDRLNHLPGASTARVSTAIRNLKARGHHFRRDTLLVGAISYALRSQ
jgi:predicted transcriptional regulator